MIALLRDGRLSPTEERELLRWLFVANAKGHFSGSSETVLDNDLSILFKGGSPSDLIVALEQQVGRLRFEAGDFRGRSWRHALFPVTYLALKQAGAKDWRSGLALSLNHQGKTHSIEYHHIFPKSVLRTANFDSSEINEIANMAFVSGSLNRAISNKPPIDYLPGVIEGRGNEALSGQRVPLDESLWQVDSYLKFLEYRRAALAQTLNDFVDGIAADRTPTIDILSLIAEGESGRLEFKSSARHNIHTGAVDKRIETAVVKTVAAFLNSDGGILLIGVNDAGIPVGLHHDFETLGKKDRDGFELFLTQLLGAGLGKDRLTHIAVQFDLVDGVDICGVRVQPGAQPTYATEESERRFYVRTGNSTSSLPIDEAIQYIERRWN